MERDCVGDVQFVRLHQFFFSVSLGIFAALNPLSWNIISGQLRQQFREPTNDGRARQPLLLRLALIVSGTVPGVGGLSGHIYAPSAARVWSDVARTTLECGLHDQT